MEREQRAPIPVQALPSPSHEGPAMEGGIAASDIYYVLFRHKWRILICGLAGLAAATVLYLVRTPPYQSEAKLFIRYVTEGKTIGPPGDDTKTISLDQRGDMIINTEVQILTSLDIAEQVADTVGPERILAKAGGGKDRNKAAYLVQKDLSVEVPLGSSVIRLEFKHPDPTIVQPVLAAVIDAYLKKHVEIHAAVGIVGDFLTQETDQLRARLAQTEDELKKATDKAGVVSIEEAEKAYPAQIAQIRQQIFSAEAEMAERSELYQQLNNQAPVAKTPGATEPDVPTDQVDQYRDVGDRLETLRKREQELLTQFTAENSRVVEVRAQIVDVEKTKKAFEDKYPSLAKRAALLKGPSGTLQAGATDPTTQQAQLMALQAKIKVLNSQLEQVRTEASNVGQMEVAITDLRRRKDLEEANYRYYAASLEQARINEALGTGKVSNISQIQTPSPPTMDTTKMNKMIAGIAASGFALGLAWSFLIEFYLDRSVRRSSDVERNLRLPLFLTIPKLSRSGYRKLARESKSNPALNATSGSPDPAGAVAPVGPVDVVGEYLRPFHETLRDRLISFFESQNLTHKPKLVAVTGLGRSAGVTTTAAGLASSLSETGEGNVLLVDLNVGQGAAQQFYKGRAICGLEEILSARGSAQVQDKLFVVAEGVGTERLSRVLPQRFSKLIPKLKMSDFDYIIFDMPPISQISVTPRLAGYMDMVLLVIESEKTDKDIVRMATSRLADSKAQVGVVLNKTKTYVPLRLHQDSLGNT